MYIIHRLITVPKQSFFLFGPRGTGKSTLMKSSFPEALWIDLLRPEVLRAYLARPERLYETIQGNPLVKTIVIDEVQKAPSLLSVVHSLIEEKKGLQFILTGSSARKLKQTSADLLGGRAIKRTLYPFMAIELGENFSLPLALRNGLIPLIVNSIQPSETLQAYIHLYLQEEIQAEGLIRNLEGFSRFLEAISFSHGAILNVSNISRECEVKRKTVENYIAILEELLLAFQLPVFSKRAQRDLSHHPKFYLFDTGIYNALRPRGLLDSPEEIGGAALEGLVAQHLKAWNEYSDDKHLVSFWRTRSGVEVDFVIYGPKGFWAIEVKSAKRIHSKDCKSLEAFKEDYPEAEAILLYGGEEQFKIKNVLCLPYENFLKNLQPNYPLIKNFEIDCD